MIECNQIAQVALELKMKFDACKVLEASDLDRLVELVEAVNNCSSTGGTTINASQIVYNNSVTGSTNTNIQDVIDEIYNLTNPIEQDNKVRVIDIFVSIFNDLNTNKIPEILSAFNSLSEEVRTVDEDEIVLLEVSVEFQENEPFTELYILKTGKGIQSNITVNDIQLINKSREISFISVNGNGEIKTLTLGFVDGTTLTSTFSIGSLDPNFPDGNENDLLYHNGTDFVSATPVIEEFTNLTGNTITLSNDPITTNEYYFDVLIGLPRIQGVSNDYTVVDDTITTNFQLESTDIIRVKYLIA